MSFHKTFYSNDGYRRSGRTTKLISLASQNSIFVWHSDNFSYPKEIAEKLGRTDLRFESLGSYYNKYRKIIEGPKIDRLPTTVIDHHARTCCIETKFAMMLCINDSLKK